jgi:hypothetical protein
MGIIMNQSVIAHILDSKAANKPLLAMLLDPEDPFSYINNSNQIPF